jgi:acetyltransferase-like isoleucine patch superfamily enzyme
MSELKEDIKGRDNEVRLGKLGKVETSSVTIRGNRNRVIVEDGAWLRNLHLIMESDENEVFIGANARVTGRFIQKLTPRNRIRIGRDTSFGQVSIINGEGTSITIGEDCMFAFDIELRTTDSHAIIDTASRQRINPAADIVIGDHVWLAAHVTVLKGVHIARDSVVGIHSVVTSRFDEEGVVLIGSPAKVVRRGVTWERPLLG